MIQKNYAIKIAVAMTVAAASLSGCGSTGSNGALMEQSQAAKADVTVSARFPSSGEAAKSLLPAGTQVIEVFAYQQDSQNPSTLIATLTPSAPTKSVKMGSGMYFIYAYAYDSADSATRIMLGQTSTGGEVQVGVVNNVNLTFMDGQWTLVNSSDSPTPLVLSNGTQLIDFIIGSQKGYAAKASIDYTKPVGGGSGDVRLRFDNNTSARTRGYFASQFVGTAASTFLNSESYNLTKQCGYDSYYGIPCVENAGDQMVMISGKDNGGDYQSGGSYNGNILTGSAESLLPGGGITMFTQNGTSLDLMSAIPDTTISGGNLITGGIVEWKPATNKITTLGTPIVAKSVKNIPALAIKAQSSNTAYPNLSVKESQTIVCSGSNPQNRGTWTFANNTSAGKVLLGNRVCYTNYPYLNSYNPVTYQYGVDAGDYSYGLLPATTDLGDYCHQWDYYNNTCSQQAPSSGDVYNPWNFKAVKSASKTTINYGSFKFNFWGETTQTGTAYIYPFRAKGSTSVKAAPAAPVITSIGVPASVPTGTATSTLTASAFDPNGDPITWSWSIVSGGGTLGQGCSGSGAGPVSSTCTYTPPTTSASVILRFTASDGSKTTALNRTLSVSDGTSVVIQ
ncbi:MAG: hypothetical protein PHI31_00080 [Desulfuromonadaceae bacterium]|nr:hypothetical protein [Desulfuromonadaceae bacterium]